MINFDMLSDDTFLSPWYWLLHAVFWAMASYFTYGVPADILYRARNGGEDAALFDRYARRSLERMAQGAQSYGGTMAAVFGFIAAAIAGFGYMRGSQFAQGLLFIIGPACLMLFFMVREGTALHKAKLSPDQLLKAFFRRRRKNQLWGMFAIILAAFGMVYWFDQNRTFLPTLGF